MSWRIADTNGEIADHYITVTREELNEPNTNICAGIRWLFHKRALLSNKLHRPGSWEDTVYDFKGCLIASKARAKALMDEFDNAYKVLKECKRS
ncbi:hypothetical protein WDW37_04975 [Bdellovibrionota bacterium FG-1]